MVENILGIKQRETSGSSTFGKYNFQYHWALCKILEKHKNKEEYALLIEYHEDVVIADHLDGSLAQFEFYQVKNQQARFTSNELTKRSKGKDGLKNSVLGKLLSSCIKTPYTERITQIGLVASNGFSLETEQNLKLDIIKKGDLSQECLKSLTSDLNSELGITLLPENLHFIVPKIKIENQEEYVLAQFAELVDILFPGSHCNAVNIYRAVIDEIQRKGRITYDYSDWERLVEEKSLTSEKINSVLAINTSHPNIARIEMDFDNLAKELGLRVLETKKLRSRLSELVLRRSGFSSASDLSTITSVKASINKVDEYSFSTDSAFIEALIQQAKLDGLDKKIPDPNELRVEIFYSLLVD